MSAILEAIYVSPEGGVDLSAINEVRALPGVGLEGDRYALNKGSFSRWPGTGRAVTLIEGEVIDEVSDHLHFDLTNGRSRRNLVTRGIRLTELVGKHFRIGTALFRGERLAEPCGYLEKRIGEGLQEALKGRCGLRAEIVEGGVIHAGDAIEVVSERA